MTPIRLSLVVAVGALLSGCGADGEPVQPTVAANVGVSGSGTHVSGGVGLGKGPFNLWLGF
ncbi:hypothetical protein [Ruegeria marina]|uniref:Lipoprotein n=1 Tax=Ruegeria marina TaxID=639004 RepID=A0A1G6NIM6_9RHOB|nr:hypothetical protein [Ruegeria marina]SDC67659.1 hypothetical protein SAMN04488239_103137 [Ruegeria marina]